LVEVLSKGNVFRFDESLEEQSVRLPTGQTVTNRGWMVGYYPSGGGAENYLGQTCFYWSPKQQYAFTTRTNGFSSPGGWVDELCASKLRMALRFVRFFIPEFERNTARISPTNMSIQTLAGAFDISVRSNSDAFLELSIGASTSKSPDRIVRLGYRQPRDTLPTTVDSFITGSEFPRPIHDFTITILKIEYLDDIPQSLPEKVLSEIEMPGYRGVFQVASSGQVQIVGTNKIPVKNVPPPPTPPASRKQTRMVILGVFTVSSLLLVCLLIRHAKTTKQ
jgi:hypothetical protein